MANIKQVADMAGVSTATVSKYLNGIKIKNSNMLAIEDAVKKLNFSRNDIARGLRTNKSMTIGVLLPELNNMFFTSIVSSIDEVVENYGYITVVCSTHSDIERETAKLAFLQQKKIDGLIAVPTSTASEFLKKIDSKIPVVLIDRMPDENPEEFRCDYILADNIGAARNAVNLLISFGHEKIAVLCGPESAYTPKERFSGYLQALSDAGISCDNRYVKFGNYTIESGIRMIKEIFENFENADSSLLPTAIFTTNNELTVGAVIALNDLGIIPGKDISFIGYDNLDLAFASNPKLSIVSQPISEFGILAANTLLHRMHGNPASGVKRLSASLIDNKSVLFLN